MINQQFIINIKPHSYPRAVKRSAASTPFPSSFKENTLKTQKNGLRRRNQKCIKSPRYKSECYQHLSPGYKWYIAKINQ